MLMRQQHGNRSRGAGLTFVGYALGGPRATCIMPSISQKRWLAPSDDSDVNKNSDVEKCGGAMLP